MIDQTTEALIEEARDIWEVDDLYPDEMIPRLVKALETMRIERDNWKLSAEEAERAEKRWKDRAVEAEAERDSAVASYKGYMALHRKVAELAAVVEKVRDAIGGESGWFRHRAGRVLDILDSAPQDALRELKADVWDEGEEAGMKNQANWDGWRDVKPPITNPYRAREEQNHV